MNFDFLAEKERDEWLSKHSPQNSTYSDEFQICFECPESILRTMRFIERLSKDLKFLKGEAMLNITGWGLATDAERRVVCSLLGRPEASVFEVSIATAKDNKVLLLLGAFVVLAGYHWEGTLYFPRLGISIYSWEGDYIHISCGRREFFETVNVIVKDFNFIVKAQ